MGMKRIRKIPVSCLKPLLFWFFSVYMFCLMPGQSMAELRQMNEAAMKEVHGQAGLTEFTMNDNTARLFLDLHIETYTTIDSFYAGDPTDYDLAFESISLGNSESDPLVIDGLVFTVDFDANSNLQRIVIGSNSVSGDISAVMNQYSGVYNDALTGGSGSEVELLTGGEVGTPPASTTFEFDSDGLFLVLTTDSDRVGFQLVSGYDETSTVASNWWDSP